jgi:hypothetical protein
MIRHTEAAQRFILGRERTAAPEQASILRLRLRLLSLVEGSEATRRWLLCRLLCRLLLSRLLGLIERTESPRRLRRCLTQPAKSTPRSRTTSTGITK